MSMGALGAHRVRTRFTVAAVSIGVASVLLLISLGHSAREYVMRQFAGIGSNLIFVAPGKVETTGGPPMASGTTRDLTLEDAQALVRQLPRVHRMAPIAVGIAMAGYEGRSRSVTVIGSTSDFIPLRNLRVGAGSNLPVMDPSRGMRVCLIGARIQRELFGAANPLGEFLKIGDEKYRVIGLVAPEGQSLGVDIDEMVLAPVASVLKMTNRRGLFRVMVQVGSHEEVRAARAEMKQLLIDRHDGEDFTIITQQAVVDSLGTILGMLTLAISAIAAISLGVAGIGIMNVMLVSVAERTSEIGLLKAIGASNRQVMAVFLAEAATLALLGGVVGAGVGIVGAKSVELLVPALPMSTPLWAIEAALGVALSIGILFGVLPAAKAARLMPLEALRGRA
jgi:putative ABC transport system permease protein